MKKYLGCMGLMLLFILVGCSKPLEDSPYQEMTQNKMVEMVVKNASTETLTIELTNLSKKELVYGAQFQLEVKQNGIWKVVPVVEGMGWEEIGYLLAPGQSVTNDAALKTYYGKLSKGEYRVIKQLYETGEPITVAAEFILD